MENRSSPMSKTTVPAGRKVEGRPVVSTDPTGNPTLAEGLGAFDAEENQTVAGPHMNELERYLELARKLANVWTDIIYLHDLIEQRNIYANPELTTIAGLGGGPLLPLLEATLHPEDFVRVRDHHARFDHSIDGEVTESAFRIKTKDGTYHMYSARETVVARQDGRPKLLLGVATDISRLVDAQSETVRAKVELDKRVQLLEGILASTAEGIAVMNTRGEFVDFNDAAKRILGVGATGATSVTWQNEITDSDGKPVSVRDWPVSRALSGTEIDRFEMFVRTAGRAEGCWVRVNARPIRDPNGVITGAVATFLDITELRDAEERIQRLSTTERM